MISPKAIIGLKIIMAGDGGVGKTTFLKKFVESIFSFDTSITIGIDFFFKQCTYKGRSIKMNIIDFGGQERFKSLHKRHANGASGAFLMFDLTRPTSLGAFDFWVDICRFSNPNIPILLLASKADLDVTIKDATINELVCKYNCFKCFKISSKSGLNVEEAFKSLILEILGE